MRDPAGGSPDARGLRFAVIVSRYHERVTDRLREGALEALRQAGAAEDAAVTVVPVPGAFELPQAAAQVAAAGQVDAIVCLGCLIRGQTPHFDFIASAVAHGLTSVSVATGVPIGFGVLTTSSIEEALERAGSGPANKGWEAAVAAVEMGALRTRLVRPSCG